ncbi:hypothetical protein [Magnetospirillum sp. UT-4]|uniref:hypothetical protein n=1 Tax=Magnetospirillum sp. UT-4 TaxID=2681467 RepID=UPI00138128AA|nr:hypothetical protein [Magnetospirillum sp. UT-4]CAA7621203.1 conserved hypothetical protein [Magnetospirillum sp. UT-4]
MEGAVLWQVLIVIVFPLGAGAFLFLYNRGEKHADDVWKAVNAIRADLTHHKVEVERRFVTGEDIEKLRRELLEHLVRIETKLDRKPARATS